MGLKKSLLLFFLILISKETFSCSCINTPLLEKYQRSDFVAKIKITKVIQDENNKDYHDIDFELISIYKGESINKIKIVAMTANAMAEDREKCILVGMDDFISKPIRTEDLATVLKKFSN